MLTYPIAVLVGIVTLIMTQGYGKQYLDKISQMDDLSQLYNFVLGFEDAVEVQQVVAPKYNEFAVTGFWESYLGPIDPGNGTAKNETYYVKDIQFYDRLVYSFVTLDQFPNPEKPRHMSWNGTCLHDATTKECIYDTFECADASGDPAKSQAEKVCALYKAVKDNGKMFYLGIGGQSDLVNTLTMDQIPQFAKQIVMLCRIACDGIMMDFEHMSEADDPQEQFKIMAHLLHHTRDALNNTRDIGWKPIEYTMRYNALLNDTNRPKDWPKFKSDGELLEVDKILRADFSQNLTDVISMVNIMLYDQPPKDFKAPATGPQLESFQAILEATTKYYPTRQISMGFEPGPQSNGGVWEGMDVDKQVVDWMKEADYGGAMMWSMNNNKTGHHAKDLAEYIFYH